MRIEGYDISAQADCIESGQAVLLCNNSSHFILVWRASPTDTEVQEIRQWCYGGLGDDETNAMYRAALHKMVELAIRR